MKEREIAVTRVFEEIRDAKEPVVCNEGGANSSKSYSMAQLFIEKFVNEENKEFLVCRKSLPSLRRTAYKRTVDLMKLYGYYSKFRHNKSERVITNPYNHNNMLFTSIDDPEKLKSSEFNYVWMEEAMEFTWDDYLRLRITLRKETESERNQLFLTYNPSEPNSWIPERLLPREEVRVIKSTYRDNPFALEENVQMLNELKEQDEAAWKIYAEGEYAKLRGRYFDIHEINMFPKVDEEIMGLDFGYSAPTALIWIGIDSEGRNLYLREVIYQTKLTNEDLIELMLEKVADHWSPLDKEVVIYADSAEPQRIKELSGAGFAVEPASKDLLPGIDFVKRFTLFTTPGNENIKKDFRGYKRRVDANGNVSDVPMKWRSHAPDAVRYGVFTHLKDKLYSKKKTGKVTYGDRIFRGQRGAPVMSGMERPSRETNISKTRLHPDQREEKEKETPTPPPEKKKRRGWVWVP